MCESDGLTHWRVAAVNWNSPNAEPITIVDFSVCCMHSSGLTFIVSMAVIILAVIVCLCIVYESKGYRTTWNVQHALYVCQPPRCDFISFFFRVFARRNTHVAHWCDQSMRFWRKKNSILDVSSFSPDFFSKCEIFFLWVIRYVHIVYTLNAYRIVLREENSLGRERWAGESW